MKKLVELSSEDAKKHFLKGSSYFNGDLPSYINFEPILSDVEKLLNHGAFAGFKAEGQHPADLPGVNYNFIANKDGKFTWRPYELMHPAIYVSLVNAICEQENWEHITNRLETISKP